jgi:hypothetical protein
VNPLLQNERFLGFVAIGSLGLAVLLANASSTAAPNADGPLKLPSRLAAPVAVSVRNNPFLAFTVPHHDGTNEPAGVSTVIATGSNGSYVPGPGSQTIDSPIRGGVPGPGGAITQPDVVVLCDTWTTHPGSKFTPTAVFLVGKESVIATAGDLVGGYRLQRIDSGIVSFEGNQTLALGDCRDGESDDDANENQSDNAPTTQSENAPLPPGVPNAPRAFSPFNPTAPQNAQGAPVQTQNVAPTSPTAPPYAHDFGATSSGYGTGLYGSSVPSSAPYPILPGNAYRPNP